MLLFRPLKVGSLHFHGLGGGLSVNNLLGDIQQQGF